MFILVMECRTDEKGTCYGRPQWTCGRYVVEPLYVVKVRGGEVKKFGE